MDKITYEYRGQEYTIPARKVREFAIRGAKEWALDQVAPLPKEERLEAIRKLLTQLQNS